MGFSDADKATILKTMSDKRCLACGSNQLTLGDGYVSLSLQPGLSGVVIGGDTIAAVALWCRDCGYMSLWKADPRPQRKE